MAVSAVRALFGRFFDTAFGYAVGGASSAAVEPIILPLVQEAWVGAVAAGDSRAITPDELANMVVQGVLDEGDAAAEAAKNGYSAESFHRMVRLAGTPPGPQEILDLWDRGALTEADVDRALLQSRLKPEWVKAVKALANPLLQFAELAEMVVQGVLDEPEAARRASLLGWSAEDFHRGVRLAGNPPGPMEMLDAWNRGLATEADVDKALVQSRLKPEWVTLFKQLRIRPASVSAAASAVIKERIPEARGIEIAAQNGIDAETFRMLVDEGGRPMPTGEALTLVRRGQMTETEFREVVARSDVKTDYTDHLLQLRTVYPSLAQMRQIIASGAMPDAQARDVLHKLGYTVEVTDAIIAAGHGEKLAGSKQLAQSAVTAAYQAQQMSRADAETALGGLGYDTNDAGLLLGMADYQRAHAFRSAVVSVVRARFLQGDIDEPTASDLLDRAGILGDERDQFLTLWKFDRESNPRLLTLAELNLAVKRGIFTAAQYEAYLPRLNFQQPEIAVLVALYAGG